MTSPLDALLQNTRPPRSKGCPRCGAAIVSASIRQLIDGRPSGRHLNRSLNLCDTCGPKAWEAMHSILFAHESVE